jgi:hypothetical protein
MSDGITITLNGEVVAKGRPRVTRRGFVCESDPSYFSPLCFRLLCDGDGFALRDPRIRSSCVEWDDDCRPTSWSNKLLDVEEDEPWFA